MFNLTSMPKCKKKKKRWNNAICRNMMDLEIFILSEITQRKTNIIWYHSYVEFHFKKIINGLIYKTETYL